MIREAVDADANAMGRLHVRAWQSAYRGVMSDEYLDGLQAEERITMWRRRISRPDLPPLLVAVMADEVVEFAAFGAEQSPSTPSSCGKLYAMNLDPDHWGRGIGRILLPRVTQALMAMGYEEQCSGSSPRTSEREPSMNPRVGLLMEVSSQRRFSV